AAIPRARRSRARGPRRQVPVGRRAQRPPVLALPEVGCGGRLLMLHIPILRGGRPYRSIDTVRTVHHRTREPFVALSIPKNGLSRRDPRNQSENRQILGRFSSKELFDMCKRAAALFGEGTLPLGDTPQTADDYVRQVSATTGLPNIMVRRNMAKIR